MKSNLNCILKELTTKFAPVAKALQDKEAKIIEELLAVEGQAQVQLNIAIIYSFVF